jgi:hypothetical protein
MNPLSFLGGLTVSGFTLTAEAAANTSVGQAYTSRPPPLFLCQTVD